MSEWRDRLLPASFRGVEFKVEIGARSGGRRIQMHEFPKRDVPFAEDMGRRARVHPVTAYLIGSSYTAERDRLVSVLEREGSGELVHPTLGSFTVVCSTYTVIERRERGGFCEVDMQFVEAGSRTDLPGREDTQAAAWSSAEALGKQTVATLDGPSTSGSAAP